MPKELNLKAYDYRNRRPSSSSNINSDDDSSYEGDDSSLRRSCGTAYTQGNETVMTGDHVEAILRMQSKTEWKLKSQLLGHQQNHQQKNHQPAAAASASSDLPSRWRQPQQQPRGDEDEDSSSDSEGVVPKVCRRSNSRSNSVGSARSTELIAQVGGDDDVGDASLQNNTNGGNDAPNNAAICSHIDYIERSSLASLARSNSNSNCYQLQDHNSSLLSLGLKDSVASISTKSGESNKNFISAVLNYGGDDEERLVKNWAAAADEDDETGQEEEEFENDEERQQERHRLIDVPHYHNIRSSFTGFVGQIKDRVVDTTKKEAPPPPPPVNYSDQHHHPEEEQKEQHYDLRPLNDDPSSDYYRQ